LVTGGKDTTRCEGWLSQECGGKALLVPSCTAALEAAFLLCGVKGKEVILPSFSYPTCASSIIRAGGIPVFVDIELETLSLDPNKVVEAITGETGAVLPIWYAGVSRGPVFKRLADSFGLTLVEDAAQCIGNFKLSGEYGCLSFHYSKNVGCGEGGALIVKDEDKARTVCSSGTTRWKDRSNWEWEEIGSSFLFPEPLAGHLFNQLRIVNYVNDNRRRVWKVYHDSIKAEKKASQVGNGHIFWFLSEKRDELFKKIPGLVKHYSPLHLTKPGRLYGRVSGSMQNTLYVTERLVRPPMNVTTDEALRISELINEVIV
jgi:dTDP-4-amino-4,6-dideoxygalactose transaminase